jgi:hypothetical protein
VLLPGLRIRAIHVRGMERLTEGDFGAVMARTVGQPILLIDLAGVRRQIENSPGVRQARIARRLPDTLEAIVVERRAIARAFLGGRTVLLDDEGMIFTSVRGLPGDDTLPEIRGLSTPAGEPRLAALDQPAIAALVALVRITGQAVPPGTTVDLTPKDRIVLRPGHDAPAVWLDRNQPERNLRNLFIWKDRVAEIAPGRPVDLRFPHRLTLVPVPQEAGGAQTE